MNHMKQILELGNKIVKLEQNISIELSKQVIDISNRIISPGFIDNHAHIQTNIHEHPLAEISTSRKRQFWLRYIAVINVAH